MWICHIQAGEISIGVVTKQRHFTEESAQCGETATQQPAKDSIQLATECVYVVLDLLQSLYNQEIHTVYNKDCGTCTNCDIDIVCTIWMYTALTHTTNPSCLYKVLDPCISVCWYVNWIRQNKRCSDLAAAAGEKKFILEIKEI